VLSRAILLLLIPLATACDSTGPRLATELRQASGNDQVGATGRSLPAPLLVIVLDKRGAPLPNVEVTWSVSSGSIDPAVASTNSAGVVSAVWTLGTAVGRVQAAAAVSGIEPALFTATATLPTPAPPPSELPYDVLIPVTFPTYDGSGQVVHPDFSSSPAAAFGYPYHLAITPFPFGDAARENPSLFAGRGALRWLLEERAPNPVILPASGYLSDPDLVYVPEAGELWLYYRQVTSSNLIQLIRSRDGLLWTAPVQVLSAPNHQIISPAVVHRAPNEWLMWSVNAGESGCVAEATGVQLRRSSDGVQWSDPEPVDLDQTGFSVWHIDVQWIPSRAEFWAVYNVKLPGGCATPAVYAATSVDGKTWLTPNRPLLAKGSTAAFADVVYRSTFSYDATTDDILFWYSGARYDGSQYVWSAAAQRRTREAVFQLSKSTFDAGPLMAPAPAPLTDWP
jgi:hypothetical protein